MSKIYFDTTPIIYFLDDEQPFSDKVAIIISEYQNNDDSYLTSSITDTEYLVFPYRSNNYDKIQLYHRFLRDFDFQIVIPSRNITQLAAQLRAKYIGLKGMDSIHLATAIDYSCDLFLTNDTQLKQVSEINVVLVDEL